MYIPGDVHLKKKIILIKGTYSLHNVSNKRKRSGENFNDTKKAQIIIFLWLLDSIQSYTLNLRSKHHLLMELTCVGCCPQRTPNGLCVLSGHHHTEEYKPNKCLCQVVISKMFL